MAAQTWSLGRGTVDGFRSSAFNLTDFTLAARVHRAGCGLGLDRMIECMCGRWHYEGVLNRYANSRTT